MHARPGPVMHLIYVDREPISMQTYTAKYAAYRHDARTYEWFNGIPHHRFDELSCPMHLPYKGDPENKHQDFDRDTNGWAYMSETPWKSHGSCGAGPPSPQGALP